MVNELQTAFNEIAELRALPPEVVLEALQSALVSAYRRDAGASNAQNIEARIDPATGRARIFVEKEVTEDVVSPNTEVTLEKARFYDPEAQIGDTVMVQVESTTKKFGRIAAQTAKQVILQKIREAERTTLYEEYVTRQGDIITGTVQSRNNSVVTLSLGRTEGILPRAQQIPGERYEQHEKLRVYIMEVTNGNRGPKIVCSRSHRNMLRRLLEYEVPEIYNGQVEIKSIAREAGYRSKVAVAALQEGIDPVGACVGMRGIRIQNIVKELNGEKIDVIEWSPDPEVFISKALSPARVTGVYLEDDPREGRTAVVVVPEDQLSLAIGREGQNARLAAKLTGWRIDIKSVTETVQGALTNLDMPPLSDLMQTHAQMIEDVQTIMEKKLNERTVMPEEYTRLAKFADLVERRLLKQRDEIREAELAQIEAVKSTLPPEIFEVPITVLALRDEIIEALEPLGTVGDVMLATLTDEDRLQRLVNKIGGDPMTEIQSALDMLMEADIDFAELLAEEEAAAEAEAEEGEEPQAVAAEAAEEEPAEPAAEAIAEAVAEVVPDTVEVDEVPAATGEEPAAEAETVAEPTALSEEEAEEEAEVEEGVLLDAFGGVIEEKPAGEDTGLESGESEEDFDYERFEQQGDYLEPEGGSDDDKRKKKRKRRQLIYDEDTGEVVSKRRRKSNRRRGEWDDFEF